MCETLAASSLLSPANAITLNGSYILNPLHHQEEGRGHVGLRLGTECERKPVRASRAERLSR